MEVARYAPPYFASSSFAWSPFDLFFPSSPSFPSSFELNICQHPIKNLKEPVYLIIFEHRIRLYIQRAYMSGVSIFSVWLIFFSVRISIHQIYNLTIVGCTLEVLVWWDYIYYVIIYSYSLNSITIYHQKVDLPLPLCTRETSCGQQEFEYISFKKWNA